MDQKMKELSKIEDNLASIKKSIHCLDCDMPISDEEHGEQIHLIYEAIKKIQQSVNKLRKQ
jgi:hypothetical protein